MKFILKIAIYCLKHAELRVYPQEHHCDEEE